MPAPLEVCITIDVEHDCPPFLTTYRGIEHGMPRLLELFREEAIPATFFTTGDVARRYPATMRAVIEGGHELGCHGDTHKRFSQMDRKEAQQEIAASARTLRQHGPVVSFRAPNLDFPQAYLPLLRQEGFLVDSSKGRHKRGSYFVKPAVVDGVRCVPASMSPSPLRTPGPVRNLICALLASPAVPFFHPWEFVDMTRAPLRFDNRLRTGEPALQCLRETIRFFKRRGAAFRRIREIAV